MHYLLWIIYFGLLFTPVTGYNILMIMVFAFKSHRNALDPVAEALAQKGHQVTVMSPIPESRKILGVKHVLLTKSAETFAQTPFTFFDGHPTDPTFLKKLFGLAYTLCNVTYHSEPEVVALLRNPGAVKYDALIVDSVLNEHLLALGHHLGIPTIYIAPAQKYAETSWNMNIPSPIYVPSGVAFASGPMAFLQRVESLLTNLVYSYFRYVYFTRGCNAIIQEVLPNSPSIPELENKVSFLLANSHVSVHPSIPSMPYFKEVGCLHCKKAKPLPKELEDYMKTSGEAGVIYFSLGSVTKGSLMPAEMRQKIIRVLSQLPQKVLWKYESEIDGLPKNIKLIKWAPQQDILAHNKTRLFISHGGGLSTFEAAYHGCPILGFPLGADQWGNMGYSIHKGFAEYLDYKTFTEYDLHSKIEQMLTDKRYKESVVSISALLKDRLEDPLDSATFWIEYVIRHKGAPHLKSSADKLNFFQYFLLDVIACFILVLSLVMLIIYTTLRMCYKLLFKTKINIKFKLH